MIDPDDPRHGTVAGYNRIPCREECCRKAISRYKQQWHLNQMRGTPNMVNSIGLRRRVQALACLGWSMEEIARRAGIGAPNLWRHMETEKVTRAAADRIAAVYDDLSMRLPKPQTGPQRQGVAFVRNRAQREGWAPPLAWENIDDPDEQPQGAGYVADTRGVSITVDDLELFDSAGYSVLEVCAQLQTNREALHKWATRHGQLDLYERLARRSRVRENGATSRGAA